MALQYHPDRTQPGATERFQVIQDAFTCLQVAEERGTTCDEDDEDDEDYFYYDNYADDSSIATSSSKCCLATWVASLGLADSGPATTTMKNARGRTWWAVQLPGLRFRRQQQTRQQDDEFRRAYKARQERAGGSASRNRLRSAGRMRRPFATRRARAQEENRHAAGPRPVEQLRERGNNAFREGAYAHTPPLVLGRPEALVRPTPRDAALQPLGGLLEAGTHTA